MSAFIVCLWDPQLMKIQKKNTPPPLPLPFTVPPKKPYSLLFLSFSSSSSHHHREKQPICYNLFQFQIAVIYFSLQKLFESRTKLMIRNFFGIFKFRSAIGIQSKSRYKSGMFCIYTQDKRETYTCKKI